MAIRRSRSSPGAFAKMFLYFLAAVAAVAVLVALLGPVAWWATPAKHLHGKDKVEARNGTRQVLLAAVGGLVLLTGAGFTARTYNLNRRGQLTDRYAKAISQLASDKLTERLGGIYALEHLMAESPDDHDTVCEVLASFVRDATPAGTAIGPVGSEWVAAVVEHGDARPTTDVQAALTVLGRRPEREEYHRIDLSATNLRGVLLYPARLQRARLIGAQLQGVKMAGAQLQGANLSGANLQDAMLADAQLQDANLAEAQLQGAILRFAQLERAIMDGAQLKDAVLIRARLRGAYLRFAQMQGANLRFAQLQDARLDSAELAGADLSGARLQDANLSGAQLRGAKLAGTNLRGAELGRAVGLTVEQLRHAQTDRHTSLPEDLREAISGRPDGVDDGEPPLEQY